MKIAYLILAHAAPEQLARLVGTLPQESPILIHFDKRTNAVVYRRAVDLMGPRVNFVKRYRCRWGQFGIVEGTLSLIDALVGQEFDYATLLSGADYPIKSNAEIAEFLENNGGQEFIESFSLLEPNRWSSHGGHFKTPEKVLCRHIWFRSKFAVRLPGIRRIPHGLKPFGGTQWWTLSREAIHYIAKFVREVPAFVSFFRWSMVPDESFIQTILSNAHFEVSGDPLRLAVWDRPHPPYPATLTVADRAILLNSHCHFARKFNEHDQAVIDMLDKRNAQHENVYTGVEGG